MAIRSGLRIGILHETLERLGTPEAREHYYKLGQENIKRWAAEAAEGAAEAAEAAAAAPAAEADAASPEKRGKVVVLRGDWGDVTAKLTREHGKTFAVLNMANAYCAGGGYADGAPAQEENMFRRTDCHYSIGPTEFAQGEGVERIWYNDEMSALLNAEHGRVLLDVDQPRVCIRGSEDFEDRNLGYPWLADDEIFPFYELRAAAVDLRGYQRFDRKETLRRVTAQLDTLNERGVRHAVLSAFGCGAFLNPAEEVAACYYEALKDRLHQFDVVAFAIFYPGYGNDNFGPFESELSQLGQ